MADRLLLGDKMLPALASSASYRSLWKVPLDARAGRYDIDLRVEDPKSNQVIQDIPRICSFVIHRQVVQIISAEVGKSYFTSGDAIPCNLKFENHGDQSLRGLRLEFSERYWPWIAQQTQKVGTDITTLRSEFNILPHQRTSFNASACAVAKSVDQPPSSNMRRWFGTTSARMCWPLPSLRWSSSILREWSRPGLTRRNTSTPAWTRSTPRATGIFTLSPLDAGAIQFDTHHTQFPSGGEADGEVLPDQPHGRRVAPSHGAGSTAGSGRKGGGESGGGGTEWT